MDKNNKGIFTILIEAKGKVKTYIPFILISGLLFSYCTRFGVRGAGIQKPYEKPLYSLKAIEASNKEEKDEIVITLDGPAYYTAFKLSEPLRLVVDINDIKSSSDVKLPDYKGNIVKDIKLHHFSDSNVSRIEIGLREIVPYEIKRLNNSLMISLSGIPSKTDITDIKEKDAQETELAVAKQDIATVTEPVTHAPITNANAAESTTATQIIAKEEKEGIANDGTADRNVVGALEEEKRDAKHYSSKKISLDFQDAEIANILRFIAEVGEFNIIISDDVKGKVNLRLTNIPLEQALEIVLKTKELGMQRDGNIIRIATLAKLASEQKAEAEAEQAKLKMKKTKEQGEILYTEVIPINYTTASDVKANLDKVKSERGDITVNDRTNTLIIRDTKKSLDEMISLIEQLDRRTPQVLIESKIVEVTKKYTKELGIQWGGLHNIATSYKFPNSINLRGGLSPASSQAALSVVNTSPGGGNFVVNLPAAAGQGSGAALGITLGHIFGSTALDFQLSALENSGKGKILSNPKITTADNKEAVIESGRSIPYATVSQDGTKIQFIDAVISLKVTPHITMDNFISMSIEATKNDADFSNQVQGTPSILKKNAKTQVLIKDGDTTVIGGLYTSSSQTNTAGVPWLSKIPVIGWLFKKELISDDGAELLIFITPKITRS